MNRLKKAALLMSLTQKLRDHESWCGETHLQKAVYILEDLLGLPLDFEFILYKHGPFSFDLRDELTSMRADELLKLVPQAPPYGPRLVPTEKYERLKKLFSITIKTYDQHLEFVAEKLGDKGVTDLEHLATALFVTKRKKPDSSVEERTEELLRIKPHFLRSGAETAIEEIDRIIEEAQELLN